MKFSVIDAIVEPGNHRKGILETQMETYETAITPVLTVSNAADAVAFYHRAFGAEEIHRNTYPDGRIVVEMAVQGARFRVADEAPESSNLSPKTLGGTTVRLQPLGRRPRCACRARRRERCDTDRARRRSVVRAPPGALRRSLRPPLAGRLRFTRSRGLGDRTPGLRGGRQPGLLTVGRRAALPMFRLGRCVQGVLGAEDCCRRSAHSGKFVSRAWPGRALDFSRRSVRVPFR